MNTNGFEISTMKNYKLINNITGWLVFAISAIVYLLTIEPTTSFWDCPEFIISAYKLEIGHPPGAPVFMLLGNLFSQFTSDPTQVARLVNSMSALLSAFTILFLFWSITHLTRKLLISKDEPELSLGQVIAVMGSGVVGALVYTFSDTFWFSAVEAEVYAFSSMLTALVFWIILKWEDNADSPNADKWIVLLAYIMGLSIGVHLLNLLCIPAIVLVYYYKKRDNLNWKNIAIALLISFGIIVVLMYGIIPGFTKVGGWFELFFVNTVGLKYNYGLFIYIIILLAAIGWTLRETMYGKENNLKAKITFLLSLGLSGILFISSSVVLWIALMGIAAYFLFATQRVSNRFINLVTSCLFVILIGFSAYAVIPIRSAANPPMDENSPEDVFSLASYLNREQYGDKPLFYGQTYASQLQRTSDGTPITASQKKKYGKVIKSNPSEKDRYVVESTSSKYKYSHSMLFPRMITDKTSPFYQNHIIGYKQWGGVVDPEVPPTFFQNIQFFVSYQLNFMYWRYFFWNFSGRQNDIQADNGITKGNWITGIPFIDDKVLGLGPQDNIAPDVVDNKGHNVYFMLPLILGIIGIFYQLSLKEKGYKSFSIVFMLFFMTGIAIVLYLNQTPFEPRERDYAYAGSFYAFSIWVGMGVAGISLFLRKYIKNTTAATAIASIAALFVPIQMASQNWDDHDRSGRYMARDAGINYLSSVGENGIIFCNGDNDTFPLWYLHEVEGFRTDTRACNLSYLQTEWYTDQMLRTSYKSAPLPIEWSRARYSDDRYSHAYVITRRDIENALRNSDISPVSYSDYYDTSAYKDTVSLTQAMENLRTGKNISPKNPYVALANEPILPSDMLYLDIDSTKIKWNTMGAKPASKMFVNVAGQNVLYRQDLMLLDMLTNLNKTNWDRPLYFAATVDRNLSRPVKDNLSLEGIAYRVVPGKPTNGGMNTDATYNAMMNTFKWGGIEKNPKIYLDPTSRNMVSTFRMYFVQLIGALIDEGKNDKALAALNKCLTVMPSEAVPLGNDGLLMARAYYRLGQKEKAKALINEVHGRIQKNLNWFDRLNQQQMANSWDDISQDNLRPLLLMAGIYQEFDKQAYTPLVDELLKRAQFYYTQGLPFLGDTILQELTDTSLRAYYNEANDTLTHSISEKTLQQSLKMMQQYSPKLLEEYSKGMQEEG